MIYSQIDIEKRNNINSKNSQWSLHAADEIIATIGTKSEFPCPFSQSANKNKKLLFAFVEDRREMSLSQSAADLESYLPRAADWDGKVSSAEPLLMVFNPHFFSSETVEGYHAIGWNILQYWHKVDPKPWPNDVSLDPHSSFWSMCFSGVQIFVNMSNPAHSVRRSRNLGSALTFVIGADLDKV